MSDDDTRTTLDDGVCDVEQKTVYHYSRERRLASAPESVRNAYEKGYTPNKGFIRGLTANAGLKSVFFSIIILSVAVVGLTLFRDSPGSASVGGYDFRLKAFLYEESVYVTLSCAPAANATKAAPSAAAIAGEAVPVTAVITALDRAGNVLETRELTDALRGSELQLRAKLPDFEVSSVKAEVKIENTDVTISSSVDRK